MTTALREETDQVEDRTDSLAKGLGASEMRRVEVVECDAVSRRNLVTGEWTLYRFAGRAKNKAKPNTYTNPERPERTHERLKDDPRDPLGRNGRAMKRNRC